MKKIFRIIFVTIILAIIILNLFSAFNLSFLGLRVFRIESGSMSPYLKVNDLIIIKAYDDYEIDDIVTYKSENEYITHRIIEKDDVSITTKGDANNTNDSKIAKEDIVGKVVLKLRINLFIITAIYIALVFMINLLEARKQKGKHSV